MTSPDKTRGDQPLVGQTRTRRSILPRDISSDEGFQFRQTALDKAHVNGLAQTLRAVGDLDPILVWEENDEGGKTTGRLVLLDGFYRLAAYATAKGSQAVVPAVVLSGDRKAAMLAAVQANTRDSLPLTKNERMDAAWQLVRLPGKRLSVPTVAKAAGVGVASVDRMRKRWVEMQAQNEQVTGHWWRDRQPALPEMEDKPKMTDAERKAAITQLAESIRKAVGKMPWRDQDLTAEALAQAIGTFKLRSMTEFLFGHDDDLGEELSERIIHTVRGPELETDTPDF